MGHPVRTHTFLFEVLTAVDLSSGAVRQFMARIFDSTNSKTPVNGT